MSIVQQNEKCNYVNVLVWDLLVLPNEEMDSLFQKNDWSGNARIHYQIYLV